MPSNLPSVSIGLAVYNGDRHLRSALDSLLAQDYSNFDILISDNASTDGTAEICHEYVRNDARVRYHRNETNVGAAQNFNRVFELSSGKYFMWAAHDDEWRPTYVTQCAEALEENPELVLCASDITFLNEHGGTTSYPRDFNRLDTASMNLRQRAKALTDKVDWFAIYGLIRSDALRRTRLCTEVYGGDVVLLMELLLQGQTRILPEPLFCCRFVQKTAEKHLEDISGTARQGDFKPYTALAEELLRVIESSYSAADVKRQMCDDLLDNVCHNNEAWARNIIGENPPLAGVPSYRVPLEIRRLFVPSRLSPPHSPNFARLDTARDAATVSTPNTARPGTFGFNVIGFVSGNLGLGVSARNIIAALLAKQFPVAVFDLDPGEGRGGSDTRYSHLAVRWPQELPYDVNLLVFPMELVGPLVLNAPEIFARPDRINVACTWWELSVLPKIWQRTLEFFDVIVACSEFMRHTLEFKLSGPSILSARHPFYMPEGICAQRERFGISSEDLVFVTSLELGSDPVRKNCDAIVEAFARGLKDRPDARLLIKINNAYPGMPAARYLATLVNAVARDPRISVVTEKLSYAEVLSLYQSADVYVSLHRSEGLGFGLLEAMALGKPVIATAWSGNMTYMDHTNACLVPYKLIPVEAKVHAYSAETLAGLEPVWADADVNEAASWMKLLADDSTLRAEIGGNAAKAIADFGNVAAEAKFAYEIRAVWEHLQRAAVVPDRTSRLEALRDAISRDVARRNDWILRFRRKAGRYRLERVIVQPLQP